MRPRRPGTQVLDSLAASSRRRTTDLSRREGLSSGESLARVRIWNLQTDLGDLDITFEPSGTRGYDDLQRDAVVMHLRSGDVTVASLADVVRSKEAADRPRDRAVLPGLRELLSTQRRNRRST